MGNILSSMKQSIFGASLIASVALLLLRQFGVINCSLTLTLSPVLAVLGLSMFAAMIAGYAFLSLWRHVGGEARLKIIDMVDRERNLYYDKQAKKK